MPRHKNAVIDTIDAFTTHLNQAKQIGLNEKIEEFDKVVQFYQTALESLKRVKHSMPQNISTQEVSING
ncbi:hypothetical protein ACT7DP_15830 [Bacillus paranthracis]